MLSEQEKQICGRLRRFREILQIPRSRLALTIGVTSERLYSYEIGRAPVRYETFAAIQKHFAINPVWLATGEENPKLEGFSDARFRQQVKPRELFSSVFDRLVDKYLTMERVNKSGNDYLLKRAADVSDPRILARFKQARQAKGMSLDALSKMFIDRKGENWVSVKDLEDFETGKRICHGREAEWWIRHLGINEEWLWRGEGKMFGAPDKTPSVKQRMDEVRDAIEVLTSKFRDLEKQVLNSQ